MNENPPVEEDSACSSCGYDDGCEPEYCSGGEHCSMCGDECSECGACRFCEDCDCDA